MSIQTLYNVQFDVKRTASVSGTRLDTYQTVSSGNSGVFRPVSDRSKLYNEANIGKEYKLFCSNTVDVKANDTVVISTVNYGVAGVSYFQDIEGAEEDHLEVVIVKK